MAFRLILVFELVMAEYARVLFLILMLTVDVLDVCIEHIANTYFSASSVSNFFGFFGQH